MMSSDAPNTGNASNQVPENGREEKKEVSDPFNPERLRLSHDFADGLGVRKALLAVPVRKPSREAWVRVHPDEAFRIQTGILELKEEREIYLVDPALWQALASEATFSPRALFTTITRQGVLSLWPIRLPGPDGRLDEWSRTALAAAEMASEGWIRVTANMELGSYEVWQATAKLPEPQWPELSLGEILKIAFKNRFIRDLEHPVLKRLRGEV